MKDFESFVKAGVIKSRIPNKSLVRDLIEEAERKKNSLKEIISKVGINDKNANDIIEYCYDILIGLIRAKLCLDGFKCSGEGAHEAEVSYMLKLGFSETEVRFMDELRYFRNGIKYYGKRFDEGYARKVLAFLKINYNILLKIIKKGGFL